MSQHRKSQSKGQIAAVLIIMLVAVIAAGYYAFTTFRLDTGVDSVVPETKATALPMPQIVVPSDSEVQYSKPQVNTIPAPIKTVKPPEPVVPPKTTPEKPEVSATVPEKPLVTPVKPPVAPVKPPEVVQPPTQPVHEGMAWVNATMAKYGVYADPRTKFHFGNFPAKCTGDACVVTKSVAETGQVVGIDMYLKPGMLMEYLLFHEIAHTHGIMDECAADDFAFKVLGHRDGQGYYQCAR